MPGFVVDGAEGWVSYGTYRIKDGECELAILDSPFARRGGGSAVIIVPAASAFLELMHWPSTSCVGSGSRRSIAPRSPRLGRP